MNKDEKLVQNSNELTAKVVAVTTTDQEQIENTRAKDYEIDGGHSANICYTQKSYDEILEEPVERTMNRAEGNKENKHHSVFGHDYISVYFEGIPKIIAMLLNNEHEYNTSEKSGRYTTMFGSEKENRLYSKWHAIFKEEIKKAYPDEKYLTDAMIDKKAKENARYLLSIFMRTKMKYTTSFRQWNYLYDFTEKAINESTDNPLKKALKPYLEEFRDTLKRTGLIVDDIKDYRNREFSLIKDDNTFDEHFGRSYSVNYLATFPALADIQRHRTLDDSLSLLDKKQFYVPEIIRPRADLVREWLDDISGLSEFPQGMLVNVNETGKYEDFIMKLYERLCTAPQLEVMQITRDILIKYRDTLAMSQSANDKKIYEELLKYTHGARCTFPGFICPQDCHFKEGKTLTRRI